MKKIVFIKNAVILTVSSLFLRLLGMVFRIYISNKIGAEALGLYQLIFAVHIFGSTLATAGFSVTVTRLVAENEQKSACIMRKALLLSALAGTAAAAFLYFGGGLISTFWIGDTRALPSVRLFAFSLPFMGASCCFSGYFLARKRAAVIARSQVFEQLSRIAVTAVLLKNANGTTQACAAVVLGDVISEILACVYLALAYKIENKSVCGEKISVMRKFLHICMPVAASSYVGSFLRMTENLIIPESLEKSGLERGEALEKFGTLKGVVLPIIFFPSAFLGAISALLIPEIAQMGSKKKISDTIAVTVQITITLSVFIANIMYLFADEIGAIAGGGAPQVGHLIKILSVITPLMYLESIVDGILKGLDMQMHTFKLGTMDSIFRIGAILILVPMWGMRGMITVMICSNVATSLLSIAALPCKFRMKWVVKPVFAAAVSTFFANKMPCLAAGMIIYSILYFFITYILMKKKIRGES